MVICSPKQSIGQCLIKLAVFALSIFYGYLVFLLASFSIIKHKSNYFKVKKRETVPRCLLSNNLGSHHFAQLENVRLHYVAKGNKNAPLMILVHGFPDFWFMWRFQLQKFSSDFYVVALDLRGFGESEKPIGSENYHLNIVSHDLKQLIEHFNRDEAIVVGHDLGGAIAYKFATLYPQMTKKLIVINGFHPEHFPKFLFFHWPQFFKSWYIFFFQLPLLPELILLSQDLNFFDKYYGAPGKGVCSQEEVEAYKYTYSKLGAFKSALNYYDLKNWSCNEKIKKLNVETLVIWGKDKSLDTLCASAMSEFIDDFKLKVLNVESHYPQLSVPETVNSLIEEYLADNILSS